MLTTDMCYARLIVLTREVIGGYYEMMLDTIIAVIIGYLLGSIPFAYIAGRLKKGVDIRQVGGGNMGALNTMREVGVTIGFAVLAADIAKGLVAVLVAQWLGLSLIWVFVVGFAAVAGHNWPIFVGLGEAKEQLPPWGCSWLSVRTSLPLASPSLR